jgi:hypothetical protein
MKKETSQTCQLKVTEICDQVLQLKKEEKNNKREFHFSK